MTKSIEPGWDLYRSFLATLRAGSLSGGARALELTQPTLSRHIAELEALLGVPLFTRSQQGLTPTEAALELVPYAETMASAADALVRAASGGAEEVRGAVRLSASEIMGAEVLPAILTDLRAAYPQIVVELVLSNRIEDLLRREVDLAVRMVRPAQAALVAKKIGNVPIGLHAHRRYIEAHGMPETLDDLTRHAVIGFDQVSPVIRSLRARGLTLSREMFALRTDSDLAQLAALRAGFGIGGCQVPIARRDPALVHVLPDGFSFDLEMWMVMHEDLRASKRMRATFDHLVAGLEAYLHTGAAGGRVEAPAQHTTSIR
jgi:DNA-binding transcriptional LysR family regulator